jgi:hypothetical protein
VDDLAIVFYTANRIDDGFAARVRAHLLESSRGYPIVCVSQKPMSFGDLNICVGETGATSWFCYHQILTGAQAAGTRYVAMAEDDSLYVPEHFAMRPTHGVARYNKARWWLEPTTFRYRNRTGMHTGIFETELLIDTLTERFAKADTQPTESAYRKAGWGEPGRYEKNLKLSPVRLEYVRTSQPVLTVNHRDSLGGRRRTNTTDLLQDTLEPWGRARDVWARFVEAA